MKTFKIIVAVFVFVFGTILSTSQIWAKTSDITPLDSILDKKNDTELTAKKTNELQKLIRYPKEARQKSIEGVVTVSVVLAEDGTIEQFYIENSPSELLENAVIDALSSFVTAPVVENGKSVKAWVTLSVNFRLV